LRLIRLSVACPYPHQDWEPQSVVAHGKRRNVAQRFESPPNREEIILPDIIVHAMEKDPFVARFAAHVLRGSVNRKRLDFIVERMHNAQAATGRCRTRAAQKRQRLLEDIGARKPTPAEQSRLEALAQLSRVPVRYRSCFEAMKKQKPASPTDALNHAVDIVVAYLTRINADQGGSRDYQSIVANAFHRVGPNGHKSRKTLLELPGADQALAAAREQLEGKLNAPRHVMARLRLILSHAKPEDRETKRSSKAKRVSRMSRAGDVHPNPGPGHDSDSESVDTHIPRSEYEDSDMESVYTQVAGMERHDATTFSPTEWRFGEPDVMTECASDVSSLTDEDPEAPPRYLMAHQAWDRFQPWQVGLTYAESLHLLEVYPQYGYIRAALFRFAERHWGFPPILDTQTDHLRDTPRTDTLFNYLHAVYWRRDRNMELLLDDTEHLHRGERHHVRAIMHLDQFLRDWETAINYILLLRQGVESNPGPPPEVALFEGRGFEAEGGFMTLKFRRSLDDGPESDENNYIEYFVCISDIKNYTKDDVSNLMKDRGNHATSSVATMFFRRTRYQVGWLFNDVSSRELTGPVNLTLACDLIRPGVANGFHEARDYYIEKTPRLCSSAHPLHSAATYNTCVLAACLTLRDDTMGNGFSPWRASFGATASRIMPLRSTRQMIRSLLSCVGLMIISLCLLHSSGLEVPGLVPVSQVTCGLISGVPLINSIPLCIDLEVLSHRAIALSFSILLAMQGMSYVPSLVNFLTTRWRVSRYGRLSVAEADRMLETSLKSAKTQECWKELTTPTLPSSSTNPMPSQSIPAPSTPTATFQKEFLGQSLRKSTSAFFATDVLSRANHFGKGTTFLMMLLALSACLLPISVASNVITALSSQNWAVFGFFMCWLTLLLLLRQSGYSQLSCWEQTLVSSRRCAANWLRPLCREQSGLQAQTPPSIYSSCRTCICALLMGALRHESWQNVSASSMGLLRVMTESVVTFIPSVGWWRLLASSSSSPLFETTRIQASVGPSFPKLAMWIFAVILGRFLVTFSFWIISITIVARVFKRDSFVPRLCRTIISTALVLSWVQWLMPPLSEQGESPPFG
jgi:hypothetical protein